MEFPEDLQALKLRPAQIGILKEGPTVRRLKGQEVWDMRYKRNAERAFKKRTQMEAKAKRLLGHARVDIGAMSWGPISSTRSTVLFGQAGDTQPDRPTKTIAADHHGSL
jgi:hypothetical protein